jgi:methionine-rich copper-binding protein CopC
VYKAVIDYCVPATPATDVKVTIVKYIQDQMATSMSANNADFPMSATWNAANIGAGTGAYNLSASGFNGDPTPYQAVTAAMTPGADYSTNEDLSGNVVAASCEAGKPFSLVGYTTGSTLSEAAVATPTMTVPAFTNLQSDKYVIVWNHDCSQPTPTPESVKVMISKFVQGALATTQTANSSAFPMSATWNAANIGAGTGSYTLDSTSATPYQTMTVAMTPGADYSTNEDLSGNVVATSCEAGKPFSLVGYTTGSTYVQAAAATPTMTVPAFTNLQSDKYVIVWNHDCSVVDGGIGGNVEGSNGVLAVTSIDSVDTTATANGSFADGWKYIFHITAPTNEQNLAMKFSNWLKTGGGGTIPVANNMRISSAQADNAGATILLTAADTYSTPALHMTSDLNTVMVGRQVEVTVEVAVPAGTPDGAYTTNYGVQTTP